MMIIIRSTSKRRKENTSSDDEGLIAFFMSMKGNKNAFKRVKKCSLSSSIFLLRERERKTKVNE